MSVTTMKAVTTRFLRGPVLSTINIPTPSSNEILVKVAYASLNPTDYKHASFALPPSKVIGCDFSGTVVNPNGTEFQQGDRIAGVVHGCKESHNGGFAEYLVADAEMCFVVPKNVGLDEASTLGVGWVSAGQALEQRLFQGGVVEGVEYKKDALLIYSAATSSGMHLVQFARCNYPSTYIIAIASTQHHERLKDYGADACFDYASPTLQADVRALGKDITKAVDCHSEGPSTVQCATLMGKSGTEPSGRIVRTLPPSMIKGSVPPGVQADEWIVSYTALGKPFWFLFKYYAANETDKRIASTNMKKLTGLLEKGVVKPVRNRIIEGGLETGILKGFDEFKAKKVRGEKLMVKIGGED